MTSPTGFKLKTETHDAHTIITEVHQLSPDPEATKAASVLPLSQVPEAQQLQAKHKEKGQLIQGAGVASRRATDVDKQARAEAEKPVAEQNAEIIKRCKRDYDGYERQRKDKLGAARLLNADMIVLDKVVRQKHMEIKAANPVYTNPGAGFVIDRGVRVAGWMPESEVDGVVVPGCHALLEDSELSDVLVPEGQTVDGLMQKFMAQAPCTATTIDGESINDYRGLVYHFQVDGKWGKRTIVALGEFPGETEINDGDITDEQRAEIDTQAEVERVAALTPEQVTAEFEAAKSGIAAQAQAMENELKFDGKDTAPAQVWYDAELVILKLKYGVTT